MKTFVIAGNADQARWWIKDHARRRWESGDTSVSLSEYITVSSINQLRGYSNPKGYFVGTWRERRDIKEILLQIHVQSVGSNQKILELINEVNG